MFCEYCGKQIDDNSKFCPYCGKTLSSTDISHFEEVPNDSSQVIENEINDAENKQRANNSSKTVIYILSFIIGTVLSFVTYWIALYSNLLYLAIMIFSWIGFLVFARLIILEMTNNDGISILGGIIASTIATFIFLSILGRWAEYVDSANSFFSCFFRLLPVSFVWAIIIYAIASSLGNNNSKNNSEQ